MAFWVYENWAVEAGGRTTVHRGECGNCNNGHGKHPNASDRNGKWYGQFSTENDAMTFAGSLNRRTRIGKCCESD
jgi:hypothetical protein